LNYRLSSVLPFVLLLLSGGATLGWQFLWTEQLGLRLGHESIALLAVTTVFFGGTALGAWISNGLLKLQIAPGKIYVLCEIIIASWGAVLDLLLPQACDWSMALVGSAPTPLWQGCVTFFVSFLVLVPSTFAMGATLPAVNEQVRGGKSAWAGLYSANTIGALIGIVFVIFLAAPQWGFRQTGNALIACNVVCALLAILAWKNSHCNAPDPNLVPSWPQSRNILFALFMSGFLGVGYEVLTARILAGVTENTVFSYAAILIIYLFATSLGAAWYQKTIQRSTDRAARLSNLLLTLVVVTAASSACLWRIEEITAALTELWWPFQSKTLGREFISAAVVVFFPAAVMGALFTHLCWMARCSGAGYASALATNALGATFAPVLLCAVLVPTVEVKPVLALLLLGYGALWIVWTKRRRIAAVVVVGVGCLFVILPPLRFVDIPIGGRLLHYKDGVMSAVSVTEDASGVARLQINNRVQEGSSASGVLEARLAQIPLALHPAPRHVLFLGVGTGFTSQVAAMETSLDVTAVELLPEVLESIPFFAQSADRKTAAKAINYVAGDARRYVQVSPRVYDVVVGDLFHPARNGAGSLYTVEQFENVKKHLTTGGVFCQWLAIYQMDNDTLRSITASFIKVFPNAVAVLANNSVDTPVIGLIGRGDDSHFSLDVAENRLKQMEAQHLLEKSDLREARTLFGVVVADNTALQRFARSVPANTDDKPRVNHLAPWATYQASSLPKQRLSELLDVFSISTDAVFNATSPDEAVAFTSYWSARSQYLKVGMAIKVSRDPQEILDQIEGDLLKILRDCPSFTPARVTLLQLADAVYQADPMRAQSLRNTVTLIQ